MFYDKCPFRWVVFIPIWVCSRSCCHLFWGTWGNWSIYGLTWLNNQRREKTVRSDVFAALDLLLLVVAGIVSRASTPSCPNHSESQLIFSLLALRLASLRDRMSSKRSNQLFVDSDDQTSLLRGWNWNWLGSNVLILLTFLKPSYTPCQSPVFWPGTSQSLWHCDLSDSSSAQPQSPGHNSKRLET